MNLLGFCNMKLITLLSCLFTGILTSANAEKATPLNFFEVRTYHANEGKLEELHTRFREHTISLFKKHQMTSIVYLEPTEKESNSMTYLLGFQSKEQRDQSWAAFRKDETWIKAFIGGADLDNTGTPDEPGNQLAGIDVSYSFAIAKHMYLKLYAEAMAEDEAGKTFIPNRMARLMGASVSGSYGDNGASWLLDFEYSDTASTESWIHGRRRYNLIYGNSIYKSGYHYLGRAIGHSLDTDSELISVGSNFLSSNSWNYSLQYHHVEINTDGTGRNTVSEEAKNLQILEASAQGDVVLGKIRMGINYTSEGIEGMGSTEAFIRGGVSWGLEY